MRSLLLCLLLSLFFSGALLAYVHDNNRAVKLLEAGQFSEGLALLKEAQQNQPYDAVMRENLSVAYQAVAQRLVAKRRYEDAQELLAEAQQFDDTKRLFWMLRGYSLLRLKKYDEAEVDLLEAQVMGEPDANIYHLLGQVYYNTDRMYEAFDALESAELYDSDNHAIKQMLEKVRRELAVEKEMDKEYGSHFVITFEGSENSGLGDEVLDALEEAYNWIGSQLDHYPDQRVTVILYTRQQFTDLTDSPEWSGGLYDGKIRLPVGGISTVNTRVQALLYHEYMHVVVRDIVGSRVPAWLNEGLAEVAERSVSNAPVKILPLAKQQDKLIPFKTLERSFQNLNGMQVTLAYEQSYDLVQFLIDRYGWHNVRDLLFALGQGQEFFAAVEDVLGIPSMTYKSLQRRWLEAG